MLRNLFCAIGAAALGTAATAAVAADLPPVPTPVEVANLRGTLYLHVGPAGIVLSESAKIKAAGQEMVGANISIEPQVTAVVEAGYFLTPNIAVSFTGGFPPIAKIEAAGTLDGMGRVGEVTYGPVAVTAHYHFTGLGRLQPYIGAGPVLLYVFHDKDGLMGDLNTRNSLGFAVQAGADLMIDPHWGVFVDVKKAYLRTEVTGSLGPAPIDAKVTLDPLVLNGGVTYRF